jgi:hypothetical protein
MKRCKTPGCNNQAKGNYCSTCYSRNWKKNNPIRYAYQTAKDNAKRRGKVFELSFEEYKEFVIEGVPF